MYVIGNRGHQTHHTIANLPCQYAVRRGITESGGEHHIRFDVAESLCELCAEGFDDSLGPVLLGGRQNNGGGAKCGDGVLRLTAAEGGHAVADAALPQHSQQRSDADQRIGVTLVDPHARVAAQQTTEGNGQCLAAHNRLFPLGLVAVVEEVTASAGVTQRAQRFPVQIDQIVAIQILGINVHGVHTIFFVGGEDGADGAVTQGVVLQQVQAHRHADTVVGAQTGAICGQSHTIVDDLDRVVHGIVGDTLFANTHHIHVRLEDHTRYIFTAGGCGLVNDDLIHVVLFHGQTMVFGPLEQVLADTLLVMGRAGHLCQLQKFGQYNI